MGTGVDLQTMADRVSGSWVAFARTGNPNNKNVPVWPVYNGSDRATMIIDREWKVEKDPNREERMVMAKLPRLPMF